MIKHFKIAGHIRYSVIKNGIITRTGEFHNDLLDSFYSALSTDKLVFNNATCRIHVGNGVTPVESGQTGLANLIATAVPVLASPNATLINGDTVLVAKRVHTATFGAGTISANLTEIGLALNNSTSTTHTRALFKDAAGNPTTVSVSSDESFVIEYSIICTFSAEDQTYTFMADILGQPTEITALVRPDVLTTLAGYTSSSAVFYNSLASFEAAFVSPVGNSFSESNYAMVTPPQFGRKYRIATIPSATISNNDIGIMKFAGFKHKFTPALPKNFDQALYFYMSHIFQQD